MTLAQLYKQCKQNLKNDTSELDLSRLFKSQFKDIPGITLSTQEVLEEEKQQFLENFNKLLNGYPLQYLLGEWEFYGIPVKVGPGVLIPRPDTETIVDVVLEILSVRDDPIVADFCSGTGAIALAVGKHSKAKKIFAVELYDKAYSYLCQNVALNKLDEKIECIQKDVTLDIDLPKLDILVSNPPYVTKEEMKELPKEVKCEPKTALLGGDDGLDFYKIITEKAKTLLKSGGAIVYEVGYTQAEQVKNILEENGFKNIKIRRDLCGVQRCVFGINSGD